MSADKQKVSANLDAVQEASKKRPSLDSDLGRFAERLHQLLDKQSARSFAIKAGLSVQSFHKYISGISEPTRPVMNSIAEAAGVHLEWLSTGRGPMRKNETLSAAADTGSGILAAAEPQSFIITDFEGKQTEITLAPNLVHMPVLSLDVACGKGVYGDNAYVTSMVSATEDWFRLKVRKDPRDMCLVHALGDSMEPLIEDGDMVFFDKTSKNRPCDGIWVFSYEERLFLKRLQFLPDSKIKVISSNTAYEPYVISINESFRLFGRYVAVLGFRT